MLSDSPAAILYDTNGNVIAVSDGAALPGTQSAVLLAGRDGATGRHVIVDAFGRPIIVGAGTAGTPVGGVVTVQGIAGATPIAVTGTVTDTDPATGATGIAVPGFASQNGHPDAAGLLRAVRAHDLDSGGGTEFNVGVNLRLSALGGSVEAGTVANPLRVDPTGTTTQPISAVSLPLPTGAATEVTVASILAQLDVALSTRASQVTVAAILAQLDVALSTRASEATLLTRASEVTVASILAQLDVALSTRASQVTVAAILAQLDVALSTRASEATALTLLTTAAFQARINTLGQKTMAASTPVVIASDQSSILVTATIPGTVDVSDRAARILGHVVVDSSALPTGAATEVTLASVLAQLDVALSTRASQVTVASILSQLDVALSTRASEATVATLLTEAAFQARINTLGQKTMANSTPVVLSSDQSAIPVTDNGGSLTVDTPQLPAALVGGRLDSNIGAWLGSTAPTVGQKTMANSVPVVISSDQTTVPTTPQVVGTHANAWSAAVVGAGGTSASIDTQYTPFISVFGNVSGGATTITIQLSQDNANFYDATSTSANGDFSLSETFGARYIRLKSSNARTITATIAGKD